jgi:bacterioferritin-associated ferredoxin|tara:strand:- start:283 stop:498 length:216 start_codon:yes stop_codon:yes gene_type:complete
MIIDKHELIKAKLKPGCICKGIKLIKILEAINKGSTNFNEIAAQTGIGTGSCQSKRCGEKVKELLGKLNAR